MSFSAKIKANSFAEAAQKAADAGAPAFVAKVLRELGVEAPHLGPHESELDEKQIAVDLSGHVDAKAFDFNLQVRLVPGPKFPQPAKPAAVKDQA